jgi:hypothetical protein
MESVLSVSLIGWEAHRVWFGRQDDPGVGYGYR